MTAVYGRNSTVADGCRQPVTRLRYSRQQTCADTVTGAVLRIPYVRPVRATADSPISQVRQKLGHLEEKCSYMLTVHMKAVGMKICY